MNPLGKLFYIIGASGAGKDTLMTYARNQLNGSKNVAFAHRYITRDPFAGNENHVHLTTEEFKARREAGFFALHWESHDNCYGIGIEINNWLQLGYNVVVNGSREYLPIARELYPEIITVLIAASEEVLINRLNNRGRENAAQITERIKRTQQIQTDLSDCIKILNDYTVEVAGDELVRVISEG